MGTNTVSKKVLRSCRRRKWAKLILKGLSNVLIGIAGVVFVFTLMVVPDPPDAPLRELLFETIGVWRLVVTCVGCFGAGILVDGFQYFEL
ncbi:hypothetical protein ACFLZK_02400 [Patescibacteria group bacterium]